MSMPWDWVMRGKLRREVVPRVPWSYHLILESHDHNPLVLLRATSPSCSATSTPAAFHRCFE